MKIKAIVAIIALACLIPFESFSQSDNFETLITTLQDKDSLEILYTVQLGAFKKNHRKGYFHDVENLFSNLYEDGFTRFYTKLFTSIHVAVAYRDQIRQQGHPEAFVLGLDGGFDRILIEVD